MSYRAMGRFVSLILFIESVFMVPALIISFFDDSDLATKGFFLSILITVAVSLILYLLCRSARNDTLFAREGFVCVGFSWIFMGIFGALPFFISREIPNYVDALFEIISGFTTTGSSILPAVEELSKSMLYWRSFSHWVGGMGVLVFLLAIVPASGSSNRFTIHLLRAESPGPEVGKLVPRMKTTAMILYILYIVLTIVNVIFLLIGGMPLFDSVCTAFGTAGTGGFGIKNDSMAGYSPYLQNVCTIFMILFGVNFNCYYLIFIRNFKAVWKDEELRLYIGIILGSIALIAFNIRGMYETLEETIRHAAFQVSSIITTTGFATTDFDLWPTFSKTILLCLMLVGACAGSTGGGMKVGRLLLLLKNLRRSLHQLIDPQIITKVRVNNRSVEEKTLQNLNTYLTAYFLIIIASFLLISVDGQSITTNLSAVFACFNNIGPGLEAVGPTCSFASYSVFSKLVLTMDMLAGRLEIFPILVLFLRTTWER